MKALHQIIEHLRRCGLLTQDQLVELASQGILRWDQVYEDRATESELDESDFYPPEEVELEEPAGRPRTKAARGRAAVHHRLPVLTPEDLCLRLKDQFDAWDEPLRGLTQVGRRLADCTTWADAAVAIRNAVPDTLAAALAAALEAQAPSLPVLWRALDMEDYRRLLDDRDAHGPAVNAYAVLVRVYDHAHLGHHVWLLHQPEPVHVFNLRLAQRRILEACGTLLIRWPDLVAAVLRRDGPTPAYWAFVLLYAARRGRPGERPWPAADERTPPRHAPHEADWPPRWAQAVAMDPAAVTPFLLERTTAQADRPRALADSVEQIITTTAEVPRDVLFRYYHREYSLEQIVAQTGQPRADAVAALTGFRQTLRQVLGRRAALRVFLQPDLARSWEAFLADCLYWTWGHENHVLYPDRVTKYRELLHAHYGTACDLLCPRSWD